MNEVERAVSDAIAAGRDELVGLVAHLVGFDTTARQPADPPRQEADLQRYLADRLAGAGASIDLWEPETGSLGSPRQVPPGLDVRGPAAARGDVRRGGRRPVAAPERPHRRGHARSDRRLDERSLERRGAQRKPLRRRCERHEERRRLHGVRRRDTRAPRRAAEGRPDRPYQHGRGVVRVGLDRRRAARPAGRRRHLHGADTGRDLGGVPGVDVAHGDRRRPRGHAEIEHPHWREGGAVNAIDKASILMDAVRELDAEWQARPDRTHPYLPPATIMTTVINGGTWYVIYPASCASR